MKYLAFTLLLLLYVQSFSQAMIIHEHGGTTVQIPVANINKITFDLSEPTGVIPRTIPMKKISALMANIVLNSFMTKFEFNVPSPSAVRICVFDVKGRIIRTIVNGFYKVGNYTASWNGKSNNGASLGKNAYIANIEIGGKSILNKLIIPNQQ